MKESNKDMWQVNGLEEGKHVRIGKMRFIRHEKDPTDLRARCMASNWSMFPWVVSDSGKV